MSARRRLERVVDGVMAPLDQSIVLVCRSLERLIAAAAPMAGGPDDPDLVLLRTVAEARETVAGLRRLRLDVVAPERRRLSSD